MGAKEHVLEFGHSGAVQPAIVGICHVCIEGSGSSISSVRYPKLGIDRCLLSFRQKRANSVNELLMEPVRVRCSSSSIEGVVQHLTH